MSLAYEKDPETVLSRSKVAVAYDLDRGEKIYYIFDSDNDCDEDDESDFDGVKEIRGNNFIPLPVHIVTEIQRHYIHIAGMSGSGKSCWVKEYIKIFQRYNPDNMIYLISSKEEDPAYDQLEIPISRIDIDLFMKKELDIDTVEKCLFIFDDIENFDENILKKVTTFKKIIAETGRSRGVHVISISHLPLSGNKSSKVDCNEMNAAVVFPASTRYHSFNLLTKYIGMSRSTADYLLKKKTRWVYVSKMVPSLYITKKRIGLI